MGRVVIPGFRKIETSGGGGGGTTNYNDLTNKPFINNVPLVGNLSTVNLKLTDKTLTEEGVPAEAKTVGTKLEEQSTALTALSRQLGSHTVKSDVPENAVFTDTVYDDTEVKGEIVSINSNLSCRDVPLSLGTLIGSSYVTVDGDFKNYNGWKRTDYIDITGLTSLIPSKGTGSSDDRYNAFYDSNKNFIECFYVIANQKVNIPPNAKYITFSNEDAFMDTFSVKYNGTVENIREANSNLAIIGKNKNFLNCNLQSNSKDGITLTKNNDGTYTLNGTASKNTDFNIASNVSIKGNGKLKRNLIKLSGTCSNNIRHTSFDSSWGNGEYVEMDTPYTLRNGIIYTIFRIDISSGTVCDNLKVAFIVNDNPTELCYYTGEGESLTADVANIKNDLDKLNALPIGTIIQIEADKDTIATTEAKYSWQYLGKSNIQYENGGAYTLVANVYRKNN